MLNENEIKTTIEEAKKYRENAFVIRSNHKIGASVLTSDGHYFGGCNIESIVSGLGVCAERSAIDHAVTHGSYEIKALAVVDKELVFPCGACLQYLLMFYQVSGEPIVIVTADTQGSVKTYDLLKLLPKGYLTKQNLEKLASYRNDQIRVGQD